MPGLKSKTETSFIYEAGHADLFLQCRNTSTKHVVAFVERKCLTSRQCNKLLSRSLLPVVWAAPVSMMCEAQQETSTGAT